MPDDRWRVRPHALVRVDPADDEVSPDGVWQVLSHGPESATSWWLMPIDGEAIRWATVHAAETVSRCAQVKGNRLHPHRQYAAQRGGPR